MDLKKILSFIMCFVTIFSVICVLPQDSGADGNVFAVYAAEKKKTYNRKMLPYAYGELTKKEQEYYLELRQAVIDHKSDLEMNIPLNTFKKLARILADTDVLTDFNIRNFHFNYRRGIVYEIGVEYHFSKDEYKRIILSAEEAAEKVISQFSAEMSAYDKVRYVHDSIIMQTDYDLTAANANNISGVFGDRTAKCDGYAHAFNYICVKAGIPAATVVGYSRGEGHAWNKVMLDRKWYNVDVTWDDPASPYKENISYKYFMLSDDEFSADHEEDAVNYAVPEAVTKGNDYYSRNGLCAQSTSEAERMLVSAIKDAAENGMYSATIRFKDERTYTETVDRLLNGSDVFDMMSKANKQSGRDIVISYFQYLPSSDFMYTFTIYFFYPDTKVSDYYSDPSKIDVEVIRNLEYIGLRNE